MAKCAKCNAKVALKSELQDGLCQQCNESVKNQATEAKLLAELAAEQAEIGSSQFWTGMKRLLDHKFLIFEKSPERNIQERMMQEVRELVREENKVLREDIETLKEENKEYEGKLKELRKEVNDLKDSLEITDVTLKESMGGVDKKQKDQEVEFKKLRKEQQERIDEQEDRSRRNNLRIGGITENKGETWADCKAKVNKFFKESLKINSEITIQRAHRTASDGKNTVGRGPRVIVLQLLNYEDKETILKACNLLKGTQFYVSQDFCKNTVAIHKNLWKEVKDLRRLGQQAFLGYRKIEIKERFEQ